MYSSYLSLIQSLRLHTVHVTMFECILCSFVPLKQLPPSVAKDTDGTIEWPARKSVHEAATKTTPTISGATPSDEQVAVHLQTDKYEPLPR